MTAVALIADNPASARSSEPAHDQSDPARAKTAFWRAVLDTTTDVDRLAQRAVANLPQEPRQALVDLHYDVNARLSRLRSQLAGVPDYELIMLVLVFYFDERVMMQLPDTARLQWVPTQTEFIGPSHGGHRFFEFLEQKLANEKTPSLIFEVFFHCLHNGFVGQYVRDPDTLAAYKARLEARIDVPAVSSARGTENQRANESRGPLPSYWHPAAYYIITFAAIIFLTALITLMTNC